MVSVGGLAAIVNVFMLVTVAIADRALELTVRNFAASRLQNRQRAPVVHDSDTWLPNLPRSVFKYHRNPAILLTVLCTVFLIASELVTEIGVDVSPRCKPVEQKGLLITEGDISGQITIVEKGASAFLLQNLTFFDGPLTRVPAKLPRRIQGNECLSCMDKDKDKYPDIVSGCSVEPGRIYRAGEIEIGVTSSKNSPFGNITHGFREVGGDHTQYIGLGDVTSNGVNFAAFVFHADESSEIMYFEYSDQEHCRALVREAREKPNELVWEATVSDVETQKIRCKVNLISSKNFETALSVYRTIQLENPVKPAKFNNNTMRFSQITTEDVYRAALSIKVMDDDYTEGTYLAYTTCGVYKWVFILPTAICLFVVFGLGTVSVLLSPGRRVVGQVPYSSRTWFRRARDEEYWGEEQYHAQSLPQRYVEGMSDEMVLLEFGEAPEHYRPRIRLRSKQATSGNQDELRESPLPSTQSTDFSW